MKPLSILTVRPFVATALAVLLALVGGCCCAEQPQNSGPHPAPARADGKDSSPVFKTTGPHP